jgi:citrate synthase
MSDTLIATVTMINVDSTINEGESLGSVEAAKLLGVKAQTLYAYASRGLVRRVGSGRARRYLKEDLERLRARHEARAGHGAVAAGALRFGEPVLDSAITGIDQRGPRYRGRVAVALAESGATFEAVAELLWTSRLPERAPSWQALPDRAPRAAAVAARPGAPTAVPFLDRLLSSLIDLVALAPNRFARGREAELALARSAIRSLSATFVSTSVGRSDSVAGDLALAFAPARRRTEARALIDHALVLVADHELNASSFAARIAASTDADLLACLTAALATVSGPRHGGACDRVDALLDEAELLPTPVGVLDQRGRRGEGIPGFGHPLYPAGDPRAVSLLNAAGKLARRPARGRAALAIADAMRRQGLPATVDFALTALAATLALPKGVAALVFALGRTAGWVAHVLEQRESDAVLRPRARYVGP